MYTYKNNKATQTKTTRNKKQKIVYR